MPPVALFQPVNHGFHRDHRIIHQQPQRNNQRTQRNPLQGKAGVFQHHKGNAQRQRHRQRHHQTGPQAHGQNRYRHHDDHRFGQGAGEMAHSFVHDFGLVRNLVDFNANRQL